MMKKTLVSASIFLALMLLPSAVSAQVMPISGGTGNSTKPSNGSLLYGFNSIYGLLGIGTNGQCLTSNGTLPVWSSCGSSGPVSNWNQQTNYGVLTLTPTTTIPVWFKDQVFASSSAIIAGSVTASNFIGTSSIASSLLGNLGVGTTSPSALIHTSESTAVVKASVILDGLLSAVNAGHSIDFRYKGAGTSYARIAGVTDAAGNTGELSFWTSTSLFTSASEALRITGAGFVGVGTTTPKSSFDISGSNSGTSLTVYQTNPNLSLTNTNTTANNFSSIDFRQVNSAGTNISGAMITGIYTSHTSGAESTDLAFHTINVGTFSEKIRLTAPGNLGIGTTTAGWLLQVSSATANNQFSLSDQSASVNKKHWAFASEGGNLYIGTSSDAFSTSTTPTFSLYSNGTVSMGSVPTTTSNAALSILGTNPGLVFGSGLFMQKTGGVGGDCTQGTGANGYYAWICSHTGGGSNNDLMVKMAETVAGRHIADFFNNNNVGTTFDGNGFVGIGSTTPNSFLTVIGNSAQLFNLDRTGSSNGNYMRFGNTANAFLIGLNPSGGMTVGPNQPDPTVGAWFTVTKPGNFGVGTTSPTATSSIQSNSSVGDALVIATSTGATVSGIDNRGHAFTSGPAPTISSCGTGTGTVVGDDQSGTITTATAATACTATFSVAYDSTPLCTVTDDSLVGFADISSISATAVTFGISSALTGGHLYYQCRYHR